MNRYKYKRYGNLIQVKLDRKTRKKVKKLVEIYYKPIKELINWDEFNK